MTYEHKGKTYEEVPEIEENKCNGCVWFIGGCDRPSIFPIDCGSREYIWEEVSSHEIICDPAKARHLILKRVEASDSFNFNNKVSGILTNVEQKNKYPFGVEHGKYGLSWFNFIREVSKEKSLFDRFRDWCANHTEYDDATSEDDKNMFNEIREKLSKEADDV